MEGAFVVRNWVSVLLKGILGMVFGVILLAWPRETIKAVLIVFGIFALLVGAVFAVAFLVEASRREKWGFSLAVALVSTFLGVLSIVRTEMTAALLLFLIAVWLITSGGIMLALGSWLGPEFKYRWLMVVEGILSIAVALSLMLFTAPTAKLLVFFFGLYLIVMGIIDVAISFMVRSYFKEGGSKEVMVVED